MPALTLRNSWRSAADDPRWSCVAARDKTADGQFWYSVSTTGIYCRPSCPSRTANPENVTTPRYIAERSATGFRPCKRCNPEGLSLEAEKAALVAMACRIIEENEEELSLKQLADAAERSPGYFHRIFKATTGLTPKDYAAAHRANKVRKGLETGNSVTEAIYDAGFNSSGRFYEKSTGMLGMTPTQYRAGGADEEISSRSAGLRSARSSSPPARRASPQSCSATIRTGLSAISKIVSRKRASSAPTVEYEALVAQRRRLR